jgi:hypothetical protein
MEDIKKYLVVDGPIDHDHEVYANGDTIELSDKAAKRLLKEKKIQPIKAAGKKNDGEDEGQKDGGKVAGENDGSKADGQKGSKDEGLKDKTKGKGGKK